MKMLTLVYLVEALTAFHLFVLPNLVPVVRAQEIPVIHQNDYYCRLIKQTGEKVEGADEAVITRLCAKYR